MLASHYGHTEVVLIMLADCRIDANVPDKVRTASMCLVCVTNDDLYTQSRRTALMHACEAGRTDTVQALLADNRVEIHLKDKVGHFSPYREHSDLVSRMGTLRCLWLKMKKSRRCFKIEVPLFWLSLELLLFSVCDKLAH